MIPAITATKPPIPRIIWKPVVSFCACAAGESEGSPNAKDAAKIRIIPKDANIQVQLFM